MGRKFKFYVTVETNDFDDYPPMPEEDVEKYIDRALRVVDYGDVFAFKGVTIIPWEDVRADFQSAMDSMIVEIPGRPKPPKRKREKVE